ncbi:unnamed protein product, partial [Symbiodinium sp. KB8]
DSFADEIAKLGSLAQLLVTLTLVLRLQPHLALTYFRFVPGVYGGQPVRLADHSKDEGEYDEVLRNRTWCGSMAWFLTRVINRVEEEGRSVLQWKVVLFNFLAALAGGPASPREADVVVTQFIGATMETYSHPDPAVREANFLHYRAMLHRAWVQDLGGIEVEDGRDIITKE